MYPDEEMTLQWAKQVAANLEVRNFLRMCAFRKTAHCVFADILDAVLLQSPLPLHATIGTAMAS